MRRTGKMKIIEMLRMSEKGIGHRGIAAGAGCGKTTVSDVLKRCSAAGITAESAAMMTDEELTTRIYPQKIQSAPATPEPDWAEVTGELVRNKNLNLRFLWEEYRAQYPEGMSYSRFCVKARQHREITGREVVFIKERKAADIMEADWMGDTLACVVCPETGTPVSAHFFVSVLGHSLYPYVEAFPNEQEQNWISAHVNALHYYGGVPCQIVPDNCKVAVTTPKYYEPVINSAYWELAQHYNVAIVPTRVRKPRDKGAVEESVRFFETWILGRLRNQRFFSFCELNKAIRKYLGELSAKPFQKRPGSRYSEFMAIDKPALKPLPTHKFEIACVKSRKVPNNYHVEYDKFYYSVPYTLYGETVLVRATSKTIEVLDKERNRVAVHPRKSIPSQGRYSTREEHMPPNHRAMRQRESFDYDRYISWAQKIGKHTTLLIERIFEGVHVEQQAYRSCMGILQFSKKYGNALLEEACKYALSINSCNYGTVLKYLNRQKDKPQPSYTTPPHDNLRGSAYYR